MRSPEHVGASRQCRTKGIVSICIVDAILTLSYDIPTRTTVHTPSAGTTYLSSTSHLSEVSDVDARPRRVASPSSSSTRWTPGASARLRSAACQWSPCTRLSTLVAGRRVRLAQLASSDQAELLPSPSSIYLDGFPMLATGSGLYFEHVYRIGSVLAAVQTRRQKHIYVAERICISSRYHPRDPPTDPCVNFRSPTTRDWTGVGGRTSAPSMPNPRRGKGDSA